MPINPDDFSSIELKVSLRNTTTRTEPKKGSVVRITELDERTVVLDVPANSCARGHSLALDLRLSEGGELKVHCLCTVRVDELSREGGSEARDQVKTTLLQLNEAAWQKIGNIYAARQAEILKFLASAKGG